jgi:hypothetical protein
MLSGQFAKGLGREVFRKGSKNVATKIINRNSHSLGESLIWGRKASKTISKVGRNIPVPKSVDEFLSKLKPPKMEDSATKKLEYQHILVSLLANKYPNAVTRIQGEVGIPRVESTAPEVVFKSGSKFNPIGTTSLVEHAKGEQTSQFMGTTYASNTAIDGEYLYHITPAEGVGFDVSNILEYYNLTHPKWQKVPWAENEIAIGRFQLPQQYKSAQKILERHEDNSIKKLGPVINNPNWDKKIIKPIEHDISSLWKKALEHNFIKN